MSLALCRECQGQVPTEAASCPHCGAPNPVKPEHVASKPLRLGERMLLALLALIVIVAAGWATQHFAGLASFERYAQLWLGGAVLCGVIAWATGRGGIRCTLGGILFSPLIVGPALLIDFAIRRARRKRQPKVTVTLESPP